MTKAVFQNTRSYRSMAVLVKRKRATPACLYMTNDVAIPTLELHQNYNWIYYEALDAITEAMTYRFWKK